MVNGFAALEGRSFIIGRGGHILVRGSTVSNQHAEIKFEGGKVLMRDLDSTNGLYLVTPKGNKRFRKAYVNPDQTLAFGTEQISVQELLDIIFSLTM
jgi:pSer/pThr/pTyr-binding forkhead associated (FHA) protein